MGDRKQAKLPEHQISMAASAIALRGVRLFLSVGRAAAEKRAATAPKPRRPKNKPNLPANKLQQTVIDMLLKNTRFNKLSKEIGSGTWYHYKQQYSEICYREKEKSVSTQTALCLYRQQLKDSPSGVRTFAYTFRTIDAMPHRKLKEKTLETLFRTTHFTKNELEALHSMYRRLVTTAQTAIPTTGSIGQPVAKIDGIDQCTFRDVMHNTFDLVTEEIVLDRVWLTWERGPTGGEGALKFESWAHGLSVLLRGTDEERRTHCFSVYDLNEDGYITKDEMFTLLKNCLLKQPGDEDPDEGVRDLVELVLKKLDEDKDGKVSMDDYRQAVEKEPLLLEAFGQCLPSKRHAVAFMKTLSTK